MAHGHLPEITQERFEFTSKMKTRLIGAAVLGLVLIIAGTFMIPGGTEDIMKRFWATILMNVYYVALLGIGGGVFVGIKYLTNAGWSAGFKRVPEAMSSFIPFGGLLLIITFLAGGKYIYEWTDADIVAHDTILQGKSAFLNTTFFVVASIVFFGLYTFFTRRSRAFSFREDEAEASGNRSDKHFHAMRRISSGFIVLFGFTFPVVSWLYMMSIDPHWYSTIYSVYNFAIMWVCTIATITLFVLFLKRNGNLKMVNEEHFHDLGKLMFAFSIFWTYIWVSQYLLIWYANIPEEAEYYDARVEGHFGFQFWMNLFVNFLCPLLVLMTKGAKRKVNTMLFMATVILLGHWNDLYLMIMPGTVGESATIGLLEIGGPIFFFSIFIFWTLTALSKRNLVPKGHPYIEESALHEVV